MAQTVADTLVNVLQKIGVKHIFGIIGDSLNPHRGCRSAQRHRLGGSAS